MNDGKEDADGQENGEIDRVIEEITDLADKAQADIQKRQEDLLRDLKDAVRRGRGKRSS